MIESQSGVQQGDPLGPLLFSLALQPILSQIKDTYGDTGLELVSATWMIVSWPVNQT